MDAPKIAIIYDFDRTLSRSEMQDGLIKYLGLEPDKFWEEVREYAKANEMDHILAYLQLLIDRARREDKPIRREMLKSFGKDIQFYEGVEEWFDAINDVATKYGGSIEHYIVSAGQKEIMEGTSIYGKFKGVYACEYQYDDDGNPVWLKNVINSTTKTQFIFRINKGELDIWSDKGLNAFRDHRQRRIQLENIIYIGDGESDIPCMKLVKEYGGHSICVYDGEKTEKVNQLVYDERVNYACKADYRTGSELFNTMSKIIGMISFSDPLLKQEFSDYTEAESYFKNKERNEGKSI